MPTYDLAALMSNAPLTWTITAVIRSPQLRVPAPYYERL